MFVRCLDTTQNSLEGASNVSIEGYGDVLRQKVYSPLLYCCLFFDVIQRSPEYTTFQIPSGCFGMTEGPCSCGFSRPDVRRALSLIISAESLMRGPLASRRLY